MSISKKVLKDAILAHTVPFPNDKDIAEKLAKIKLTFGEFAEDIIEPIRLMAEKTSLCESEIYTNIIDAISEKIIGDFLFLGGTKQRVPMLPELQKAIEKRGYSFQLLRGTSYLCEVQISTK